MLYISQYFYPIVEGIIRFSLRNIKVNLIFQILAFVSDIPDTDIFRWHIWSTSTTNGDQTNFVFSIFACFSKCFVRLNLLMLKNVRIQCQLIALLREDETLFSKGFVMVNVQCLYWVTNYFFYTILRISLFISFSWGEFPSFADFFSLLGDGTTSSSDGQRPWQEGTRGNEQVQYGLEPSVMFTLTFLTSMPVSSRWLALLIWCKLTCSGCSITSNSDLQAYILIPAATVYPFAIQVICWDSASLQERWCDRTPSTQLLTRF